MNDNGIPPMPQRKTAAHPAREPMEPRAEIPADNAGTVSISPEMVCYRDAEEICSNCSHFGHDRMCAVLKLQVEAGAGCNAYSGATEEPGEPEDEEPES